MTPIKIGDKLICDGHPTFIIAEAGSNHDGSLKQALRLIDIAADAGADAIKFQLFRAEYLYPPNVGVVKTPAGSIEFFDFLKKMSMPIKWLERLTSHASKQNIYFLASAFDEVMVDVLEGYGILAHKIASPELNHLPLIRHMSRQGKPILISTGMSSLGEIEEAIEAVVQAENTSIALLHCISSYPTPPEDCNLRIIPMLKQAFQLPVGFSDHTLDPYQAPRLAVALGANLIEKHFTLNRQLTGPDHPFAIEPAELCEMVQIIRETENLSTEENEALLETPIAGTYLGSSSKRIAPSETKLADCDRRSVMVVRQMRAGDRITPDTVRILRAERNLTSGLAPKFWDIVIGRHVIRDVPSGHGLLWDDLLS